MSNLERIIAKNPTSSLFARLADTYLQQGDVNRAIEVCRQGLRYRPFYVSGHGVLGKSYFSAGMFEEARRAFNKVLHLDPHHIVAIWYLGQIDRAMGWDDLALRNFQKARDLDPLSQSLQKVVDEVLTSISSQMGQRLRDEVSEGNDPVVGRVDPVRMVEEIETNIVSVRAADHDPLRTTRLAEGMTGLREGDGSRPSGIDVLGGKGPTGESSQGDETFAGQGRRGRSGSRATNDRVDRWDRAGRSSGSTGEGTTGEGTTGEGIPITTATLAEIYAGQGLTAQAIAIFEKVVEREPDNVRAWERLNALKAQRVANPSS